MSKKFITYLLTACLLLTSVLVTAQQNTRPLSNNDVVNMLKIRLPESAIVAAIAGAETKFDTSPAALAKVRRRGASQAVLDAMVNAGRQVTPTASLTAEDARTTTLMAETPAEAESAAALPSSIDEMLEKNAGVSSLLFTTATAITPATCVEKDADTMEECHGNYQAGCSYSAHPKFDAYLNYLKNLLRNPSTKPDAVLTKADFASRDKSVVQLGLSSNNHAALWDDLRQLGDGRINAVMGYLYYGFPTNEGKGESCNCYLTSDDAVDYHIGIGFDPFPLSAQLMNQFRNGADIRDQQYKNARKRLEQTSVVIEMTPHYRAKVMPKWTIDRLRRAIGRQVYVVGQLMVDNAHIGLSDICSLPGHDAQKCWRYSAWEIHPVTQFWVCTSSTPCSPNSNAGWARLENMP